MSVTPNANEAGGASVDANHARRLGLVAKDAVVEELIWQERLGGLLAG